MRVIPNDDLPVPTEAQQSASQPRTASLHALPILCHHTVRSVSQHAFKTLWIDEPDRRERWNRIGNMDQAFGTGRPLRTISKSVLDAALCELWAMGMSDDVVKQHFDDLACLMIWAESRRFLQWAAKSLHEGTKTGY